MDLDYNPSRRSFIQNKWVATIASIWIQCTAGSLYTFSVYSSVLKSSQDYDQSTLDTISVCKDLGANMGILSGVFYSAGGGAGPWVVLVAGAIQNFAGYFLMWLTVTGSLPRPPVVVMCLYMLLAAHASAFYNTANLVTGVHNFPDYGGTIVGIMKGFLGLGGAILIQMYQTTLKNKPSAYLLLLALLPTICSLLLMWFVRIYKTNEDDEKRHLNGFSLVSVLIAAYLTGVIIVQNILKLNLSVRVITLVFLLVLLLSPISIAINAQREKSYRMLKSLLEHNQLEDERDLLDEHTTSTRQDLGEYHEISNGHDRVTNGHHSKSRGDISNGHDRVTSDHHSESKGDISNGHDRVTNDHHSESRVDITLLQALGTTRFWFLFFITACAMGSGLTSVNNTSQIGESLGYSILEINTLVSLWSIWNFLGRVVFGYISDYFLHAKGCPRPLVMVITLAIMSIGYLVIAFGFPGALYIGSILVGICYGAQWSLMPTIISDLFGNTHLGTIFNTITIACPIGSYLLSVRVVGYIYDRETPEFEKTCMGTHCFKLGFIIMAAVTFLAALIALALFLTTRNFYKNVLRPRILHSIRETKIRADKQHRFDHQ
ncbi:hypothetical protein F511_13064 [Dorcoceras hygrometricum]|uniref:Major facilitator superfamily (MFS) profile domain-containing protein n=1 Tax=Dorcoceras hygrometricum TaxID=472368 RepID=A0A2Z7BAK5_9LAMI|nr:hypothetical protein F511_13064 [Dorcoceras hygrometricum]